MKTILFFQKKEDNEWVNHHLFCTFDGLNAYDFCFKDRQAKVLKMHLDWLAYVFPNEECKIVKIGVIYQLN